MSETFGQALRRLRRGAGLSQPQLAQRVPTDQSAVSRWETGRTTPSRDVVEQLDELLDAGGDLARLVFPAAPEPPRPVDRPVTGDDIDDLRASITNLVTLDGQHGGAELVPLASRMFRTASARLASGNYPARLEADFAATVAELGEVAGWLAFDAMHNEQARSLNLEALHLARLAGDTSMEMFVLGNMALLAQESGQPREALRTVQLMERTSLSPRMRVMTALRRARAGADLGDERALTLIRRAQSEVDASIHRTDPDWAWWVDHRELRVHEGGMWRAIGRPERAVDCYAEALEAVPQSYRWASYLGAVNLAGALVEVQAWTEAERVAEQVATLAPDVTSGRASKRLRDAAAMARRLRAPSSLDGLLSSLAAQ